MIGSWFGRLKFEDAHPVEETLLACIDGELSTKEATRVRTHLEECWSCRARLDEIEETITLFVNFRNQIQQPLAAPPPSKWGNFDRQLAQLATENVNAKISIPNRLGFWQRFRQSLDFGEWSPVRKQIGIGSTAAILVIALLWQAIGVRSVSAVELLENSIRSQKQTIRRVNQPIVYQRLRLERAGAKAVDWETWHDSVNSRYRQAFADEHNGRRFLSATMNLEERDAPAGLVLREISAVLQANRMNPQQPLSAESFRAWRGSLPVKRDEVINSYSNNGKPILILKTVADANAENGKITHASLAVRARDWHAEALRLSIKSESGTREYVFVETSFEVVSLPSLNPEIFSHGEQPPQTEIASASLTAKPTPAVNGITAVENNELAAPIVLAATAASVEMEVEALRLLNSIGADIGAEATVSRTAANQLLIEGVVESLQRKAEITRALAPLIGNPNLRVRIETSEEAQKRIARERTLPTTTNNQIVSENDDEAASIQPLEIRDAIPADAEVRSYLRSKGTPENILTGEVNRFTKQAANRSNQVLLRALALKNLARRFSENQLRSMKPEAKNQWLTLIATRAQEIKNHNAALRQELGAVFGDVPAGGASIDVSDEAGLQRLVVRLSELAASNDRAIRAAFTFSSVASTDGVKRVQFRQSLGSIEELANSIHSATRKLQSK